MEPKETPEVKAQGANKDRRVDKYQEKYRYDCRVWRLRLGPEERPRIGGLGVNRVWV